VRVARIAAGVLNRFRHSLALTPTLSPRERGTFWDRLLYEIAIVFPVQPAPPCGGRVSRRRAGGRCGRFPDGAPRPIVTSFHDGGLRALVTREQSIGTTTDGRAFVPPKFAQSTASLENWHSPKFLQSFGAKMAAFNIGASRRAPLQILAHSGSSPPPYPRLTSKTAGLRVRSKLSRPGGVGCFFPKGANYGLNNFEKDSSPSQAALGGVNLCIWVFPQISSRAMR